MAAPDFRLAPPANSDDGKHFDDVGAIGKTVTPEIVLALCGPMGTPLHEVAETFQSLLAGADYGRYDVKIIKLSDEIRSHAQLPKERSILKLIEAGNQLRQQYGNEILARLPFAKLRWHVRLLRNEQKTVRTWLTKLKRSQKAPWFQMSRLAFATSLTLSSISTS